MEITTNQLSLTGVIMENPQFDHEVFGEAFFRTVLSVPRLSGAFDLLPLTISERLMGEDFQEGATVAIGGQLRSYNKVMGGAGRLLLTAFAQHLRPVDEEENPNLLAQRVTDEARKRRSDGHEDDITALPLVLK